MSAKADYSHWAKKFDHYKHVYAKYGTLCGSVAACLGNNYATTEQPVCPDCKKIQDEMREATTKIILK